MDVELGDEAFAFSLAPDGSTHLLPDSVSQRYGKLGIQTTIHKLRHCSATELSTAGVDIRMVAGRLGHGRGGTITLRVYTAWVSESDQRASTRLVARMPARPSAAPASLPAEPITPPEGAGTAWRRITWTGSTEWIS
jgi:integrase